MKAVTPGADLYLGVREKEGRLYSDDIVARLPEISMDHPLRAEWQIRGASARRLAGYLADRFPGRGRLLDLGCGNGWLANQMTRVTRMEVAGVDRNHTELAQARRVFGVQALSIWLEADILEAPFPMETFNAIVIASAIQYFADLPRLMESLVPLLKPEGEIHILDSPFYSADALAAARERTRTYYDGLGFPEMVAHYHHHSPEPLSSYNPVWLYTPGPARQSTDSPFPWICLKP